MELTDEVYAEAEELRSFLSYMPWERWVVNWLRRRDGHPPLKARAARARLRVLNAAIFGKPSKGGPA